MKLPASRVAAFLHQPDPAIRAVLLYGPDAGLIRERADTLARGVCPDLHDPFRVADLSAAALAADPARLADEAAQMSLMAAGGLFACATAPIVSPGCSQAFSMTLPATVLSWWRPAN